jgi:hypothetical protein
VHKRRSVFTIMIVPCLILTLVMAEAYGQQRSSAPEGPEAQKPAKSQKPEVPVVRNRSALAGFEVLADLSVSPRTYSGPCPTPFTFQGKITVNRAAVVHYRFVRSDNTRTSPAILTFEKAGTQEVTDSWQFDGPAQPATFSGWEAIQIILPLRFQSNVAFFNGTCTERSRPSPGKASAPQKPSEEPVPGSISIPADPQTPLPEGAPGSSPPSEGAPAPGNPTLPAADRKEPPVK